MKTLEKLFLDDIFRFGHKVSDLKVEKVVMNTKDVEINSIFFGINNGNNYIPEALDRGASFIFCDNPPNVKDSRIIVLPDTVKYMQELATKYRKSLGLKIVAITGSNGKTTTKDILYSILKEKHVVQKTQGNYNNHIGVPFSILQLREEDEVAVLELGMSDLGEIDLLSQIALPDYGIITNIGDSHLEFLKTRENVFKAKTEIVKYLKKENLVVYGDDPFLKNIVGTKVGFGKDNDIVIRNYRESSDGVNFSIGDNEIYNITLNGIHNCLNTVMAIKISKLLNLSWEEISKGLKNISITPMRFEKLEKNNILYINDAYNASPISMVYSLDTFNNLYNESNFYKVAILGDMLELGEGEINYHKEIISKALDFNIEKIFLYGPLMKVAFDELNISQKRITHFADKNLIKNRVKEFLFDSLNRKLVILLKGSRGMKLEEII